MYFIEKTAAKVNLSEEISKYIPNFPIETNNELRKVLTPKPYDMFISESKDLKDFYSVTANVDIANILGTDTTKQANPVIVNKNNPERFLEAAYQAVRNFEKLPNYKELVNPHVGFWKFISNLIRNTKS